MSITTETVCNALSAVVDEYLKTDYVSAKWVRDISIAGNDVSLVIELGYPAASMHAFIRNRVTAALQQVPGIGRITVDVTTKIITHAVQHGAKPMPGVKNIIAVSSGKGGVGKSTVTANVALALAAQGARVGVLDADIYGPSQPTIMGISEKPTSSDGEHFDPVCQYGLQLMSIGFMMDSVQPLAWRAPMMTQALMQLLQQTRWDDLDYLLIDMPPGTGDIQMTLSQKAPLTGAVVVTTPQDVAVLDARKGLMMFQKMGVDILGIVENMGSYVCSHCGQIEHIFGKDGGKVMSEMYGVDSLGSIPLNIAVREQTDAGRPIVLAEPDGLIAIIQTLVVNFIGEYDQLMFTCQIDDFFQQFVRIQRAGRIVRIDDDDRFRMWRDFRFDIGDIRHPVVGFVTQIMDCLAAGQRDRRRPQRIIRCRNQHFVTVVQKGLHAHDDQLGRRKPALRPAAAQQIYKPGYNDRRRKKQRRRYRQTAGESRTPYAFQRPRGAVILLKALDDLHAEPPAERRESVLKAVYIGEHSGQRQLAQPHCGIAVQPCPAAAQGLPQTALRLPPRFQQQKHREAERHKRCGVEIEILRERAENAERGGTIAAAAVSAEDIQAEDKAQQEAACMLR